MSRRDLRTLDQIGAVFGRETLAHLVLPMTDSVADKIVAAARAEIGRGEAPGPTNNSGPDVARYFGVHYYSGRDYGEWCAAFVSYVLERASAGVARSAGAKKLLRNVAARGRWVLRPRITGPVPLWLDDAPSPGDVVAWHRGGGKDQASWWRDWRGHVAIVVAYDPETDALSVVDGNGGGRPAVVRERVLVGAQWRRRLYGVARPTDEENA